MTAPIRNRADAVRNAEKVLAAAREVFAERGLGAGIDEVAVRAGVGAQGQQAKAERLALIASLADEQLEMPIPSPHGTMSGDDGTLSNFIAVDGFTRGCTSSGPCTPSRKTQIVPSQRCANAAERSPAGNAG